MLFAYPPDPPEIAPCLAPRMEVGIIRSRLSSLGLTYLFGFSPGMPPGNDESRPLCFFAIFAELWFIWCSPPELEAPPCIVPPFSLECRALLPSLPCGVAAGSCGLPVLFVTEYEPVALLMPITPPLTCAEGVPLPAPLFDPLFWLKVMKKWLASSSQRLHERLSWIDKPDRDCKICKTDLRYQKIYLLLKNQRSWLYIRKFFVVMRIANFFLATRWPILV